uniref:Uncharacterized protein n=2 Tax=Clytia hemisphaerica TaxID=252671 RepID=A0A7M5X4Q0_9CNID
MPTSNEFTYSSNKRAVHKAVSSLMVKTCLGSGRPSRTLTSITSFAFALSAFAFALSAFAFTNYNVTNLPTAAIFMKLSLAMYVSYAEGSSLKSEALDHLFTVLSPVLESDALVNFTGVHEFWTSKNNFRLFGL